MSEVYLLSVKCEYLRFFQVINRGICVSEVYLTTEAMYVSGVHSMTEKCVSEVMQITEVYIYWRNF